MDCTPLVSVLLPAYNAEKYICRSINSILSQDYKNFELLIINDGSVDKTKQLVEEFGDPRIKLINLEENVGLIEALNIGLSKSRGKYIARMDSDDISVSQRFTKQVRFLESNTAVVACGSSIINFNERGYKGKMKYPETHDKIQSALKLFERSICHPSVMIRAEIINKNNIKYRKEYLHAEDYVFWKELSCYGKLHNLQDYLLLYSRNEDQISSRFYSKQISISRKIVRQGLNEFFVSQKLMRDSEAYINLLVQEVGQANFTLSPLDAKRAYKDLLQYAKNNPEMNRQYSERILLFKLLRSSICYRYSMIYKIEFFIRCFLIKPRLMLSNIAEVYRLILMLKIKI